MTNHPTPPPTPSPPPSDGCHEHEYPNLQCSYGHSYSGTTSVVNTVLTAAEAEAAASTASGSPVAVQFTLGSGIGVPAGAQGLGEAANLTAWADVVVLVVGLGCAEAEGRDRTNLTLTGAQRDLISTVTAAMKPTSKLIVAIASAGGVDLVVPRADALLQIFYNGEETGSGLWDVVLGRLSPSARMPETVYAWQYLTLVAPEVNFNMVTFGTGRTYRFFNNSAAVAKSGGAQDTYIRYRFGYGLSYCTFAYSNLVVKQVGGGNVTVDVDVAVATPARGSGGGGCREVTQVYLTLPSQPDLVVPIYSLVGFAVTPLPPPPAAPTHLTFIVPLVDQLTTLVNGTRVFTGGVYTYAVGGHLPDDTQGEAQSNTLVGTLSL